jgi:hypothetical protein
MRPTHGLAVLGLVLSLLIPGPVDAQFSIKGGVNLVDFFGDDVEEADRRPRLAGGAAVDLLALGPLALAPEIYYAQKGAEQLQQRLAQGQSATVSLSYIEIPVLVRLNLPAGPRVRPYIAAGPVFGWQVDCSITANAQTGAAQPDCEDLLGGRQQLEEKLRSYEQGLMVGAGLAVRVLGGLGAITLDARYARGLTRLSDEPGAPEIRNRALSVLLGYRFGLQGLLER